jgi:hypothetical protein
MHNLTNFHYSNVQKHQSGGKKTLKKVIIKKGKGHKSVSYYNKGKIMKTIKKPIHQDHIILIYKKQFIPGLFSDCQMKTDKLNKTNKFNKRNNTTKKIKIY